MRLSVFAGVVALWSAGSAPAQLAQSWDFEEGFLYPWTITGDAFDNQPTFGNNIAPRRPGESPGQSGNYWIGSYEDRPRESVPPGRVHGDGPQGEMLSPQFITASPTIDFLIGGGADMENERVTLLVKQEPDMPPPGRPGMTVHLPDGDYVMVYSETGRNEEAYAPSDLEPFPRPSQSASADPDRRPRQRPLGPHQRRQHPWRRFVDADRAGSAARP